MTAAATTYLIEQDMDLVVERAEELAGELDHHENIVDRSIVERFKEIFDAYAQGHVNIEAVAVPLVESMANVIILMSYIIVDRFPNTTLTAATEPGIAILILGLSSSLIEKFTPRMSQFLPLSYLLDVQKFSQKHFTLLKDSIGGKSG